MIVCSDGHDGRGMKRLKVDMTLYQVYLERSTKMSLFIR